ncbi:MAG: D-alanyl-D-alanine carboxypeptidase/D-alanyl-D-alanine-endopeptidase [Deltaproteobacteria bacterium]|nr:D-alanyl-D-alanine carboxypeptidase/D-alanyl-D-alanine-endopeptidase [Deltaproteobacteria bacterium]
MRVMRRALVVVLAALIGVGSAGATASAKPGAKAKPAAKAKAKAKPAAKAKGKAKPAATATATHDAPRGRATRGRRVRPDDATAHARVSIGQAREGASDAWRRARDSELSLDERTAKRIEAILRGPLRAGTTALYVVDADTGRELFSVHPDDPLNPASNVKLISTATALEALGPDHRYQTRLYGPVPDADGSLAGDVYLYGSYDPTLGPDDLEDLARTIAARGITRIDGGIVVGPEANRDAIFRAKIKVTVTATEPGLAPTVEVDPPTAFTALTIDATTARGKRGAVTLASKPSTDGDQARLAVTIKGTLGRGKTQTLAIWPTDRGAYTAEVFRAALARAGVAVSGGVRTEGFDVFAMDAATHGWLPVELGTHQSEPLAAIVAQVNKRSINWLADRVVMTAAAARIGAVPSMTAGVDAMYRWLGARAGVARDAAVIDTGSGLSYKTELSARQIVEVLRAGAGVLPSAPTDDTARACHAAYLASLSVAGVDGTLRGRFHNAMRGKLTAKTGTLSNVIALSGFLEAAPGQHLAFALITNGNRKGDHHAIRVAHEQVVGLLYDYATAIAKTAPETAPVAAPTTVAAPAPVAAPTEATDDEADDEAAPAAQPSAE